MREAGDVAALGVDEARASDEEARQHGAGPGKTAAQTLHVGDGGNGAQEQRAATDERHEDDLLAVEADLVRQK